MPPFSYQQHPPILTHHQNSRSLETLLTPPGMTNEGNSLSPSTSSPVTPTSQRGSVISVCRRGSQTASYRNNQASHNASAFIRTPRGSLEQLGPTQQFEYGARVDTGSPSAWSSSEASSQPAPVFEDFSTYDIQTGNDNYQSSYRRYGILSPQQFTVATPHHRYPGNNINTPLRSIGESRIPHSLTSDVLPSNWEANVQEILESRSFGLDGQDNPVEWQQPMYGSSAHILPSHSHPVNSSFLHIGSSMAYDETNMPLSNNTLEYMNTIPTAPQIICSTCGQDFNGNFGPANLRRHIRLKHRPEEIHRCQRCPKTYKRTDALKKHVWKTHRCLEAKPKKRKNRVLIVHE
jgi:uncharacterized C2H2 Zn-finger protein